MTKRTSLGIVMIIALLTVTCSGSKVVSFINNSTDFSKFNTYRIVAENEEEGRSIDTSQVNIELEELITQEIERHNYRYHPRPDLRVHYRFIPNTKTDYNVDSYNGYNRYGSYGRSSLLGRRSTYYNPYSGQYYQPTTVNKRSFYEAILLIELRDRTTGKSVWQGSLDLKYTKKSKDKKGILPEAVKQIFDTYPYVAGSNNPITPVNE